MPRARYDRLVEAGVFGGSHRLLGCQPARRGAPRARIRVASLLP